MGLPTVEYEDTVQHEITRTVIPGFTFSCERQWKGKSEIIIYHADKGVVKKLTSLPQSDQRLFPDSMMDKLSPLLKALPGPTVVSGGHTVINMSNTLEVSASVLSATAFSMEVVKYLTQSAHIHADFLVQVNDLFMENAGNDIGAATPNKYRKLVLNPYVLPTKMADIVKQAQSSLNRDLKVMFCAEKNMADRFKRHVDKARKDGSDNIRYSEQAGDRIWSVVVDGEEIPYMVNDKPNCVAANAAMLRAIRYKIDARKTRDNYQSYVGIFPLCSIDNVLNGYRVAHQIYDLDLPTYYIFSGNGCA